MRRSRSAVLALVFVIAACSDEPVTTPDASLGRSVPAMGSLTALVDDSTWTAGGVDVRHGNGMLWITATGFGLTDEDRQHVRLALQTTVGAEPQEIGPGNRRSATLTRDFVAGWLAEDSLGSGSITLTSLTADRATGTFSFIGVATQPVSPKTRLVKDGKFNVRLR